MAAPPAPGEGPMTTTNIWRESCTIVGIGSVVIGAYNCDARATATRTALRCAIFRS
jgi:hypothetical protein